MGLNRKLINQMIEYGRDIDKVLENPEEHLKPLRLNRAINYKYNRFTWEPVLEEMNFEDCVNLAKCMALAEETFNWNGGSVAATIWIFKYLREHLSFDEMDRLASWIIQHNNNDWVPFGNMSDRDHFIKSRAISLER